MTPPSTGDDPRVAAVVLAAGLGTRMKSRTPKLLHELCGRPMVAYVIDAARAASGGRPLVVTSPATAAVRDALGDEVDYALQPEPRGTGDAVASALAALPAAIDEVLILSGDVPLMEPELLRELLEERRLDEAAIALIAVDAMEPGNLGRVVRDEAGIVDRIVERKDATEEELSVTEINSGLYAFDAAWLRGRIGSLKASPKTGELYLTELIELAREDGRVVVALTVEDDGRLLGINDRAELAQAEWDMRTRINATHMIEGVTMRDPSTVYVDATVTLATDVTIEPNVILLGSTSVGEGTTIGAGSQILDSAIGADCVVWASIVESSTVEDGARVGPFSHLRPGSVVGKGAEVGNFAELKNARLGEGVKQHHVSYLGDADLGAGTNVGAGTITANFDGQKKHRTTVGERVFLGVDTMLRAPITLGDDAKTGAGAVVTKDVPAGKLAVGVPARIREPRPKPQPEDGSG
ncbi:MAG TPA: bifunctional UDP-N-acetylglucosamine diphosphorylase/glucosamine-1-phosphate N-acetyltransferase GlmU [Candidatus Limnocylindrales bacterium]|nr:bifunctional UDP-N-acetylglucosamine diphosphorylase/glucosamine-1-phosphate N-acetyltransferase GlmU [Candidatus Limnocylindrales bacterium]